jgi:16S rRNA (cytidine1402-2'-O)-methyltransferase
VYSRSLGIPNLSLSAITLSLHRMGKLIIVPTPIGNLEDITLRSLNMLKSADLVLAEDTRVSRKLLSHYEISTPLRAFHQHNEHGLATQIGHF